MSADSGKRIVLLDEFKSVLISSLFSHPEISLDTYVCRAGCLTRSRSCVICRSSVVLCVIEVPVFSSPLLVGRKEVLGILNFGSVFSAKLLSQFNCACRAEFNASSAGYAFLLVNVGNVCRT